MSEVQRSMVCSNCGLGFLLVFEAADQLMDQPVRIDCPRVEHGLPCAGFILTHLPARYRVLPAPRQE